MSASALPRNGFFLQSEPRALTQLTREAVMTSGTAEFSQALKPRELLDSKSLPLPVVRRIQESWLAASEKHALLWLAARAPSCIGSDHLTVLGMLAQLGAGACYALGRWNKYALLGVILCL